MLTTNSGVGKVIRSALAKLIVVIGGTRDRFLEDRRVGGHALQAVLLKHAAKFRGDEQMTSNVIEPHALSEVLELL